MDEEDMTPGYYNLKNGQQQADMDGIMVLVSRKAVEEVLSEYAGLETKLERLESLCQEVVEAKDEYKRFNSTGAYDSAFAAYDRMHDAIDKIRKEGEQDGK